MNNSRFAETPAGDRVRSALGGPACSVMGHILGRVAGKLGTTSPVNPASDSMGSWSLEGLRFTIQRLPVKTRAVEMIDVEFQPFLAPRFTGTHCSRRH